MQWLQLRRHALGLQLALVALVASAAAEEIIVRNDSISDFGQAVIVGDFVAGEQAGVRLASPCNGTIVGIQILWLEGTPGHEQSLEEGIHIYDGTSFPIPGAELALMEGPVLTPGFLNEYRYLDEAQTIPLSVPVLADQEFIVTLEYYNPTDVGNGGPSVVRDTNGCQSGRNVLYAMPGVWLDFCTFLSGDLGIRAVIECPGATGACCYADGSCAEGVEEGDCLAEFGAEWHSGRACEEITCMPRGACCLLGGCLQLVDPATCEAIEGVYAGHGADCGDDVCVPGACCMPEGDCLETFEFECVGLGGAFQGPGTNCDPNPCPQPTGACCFGTICIADQTSVDCTGVGGEWAGPWTDCGDDDGDGVPDACEPSAVGDLDCDGDVDFDDINPFVLALSGEAAYNAQYPDCDWLNADCDLDADVDFDDINAFVDLLGT